MNHNFFGHLSRQVRRLLQRAQRGRIGLCGGNLLLRPVRRQAGRGRAVATRGRLDGLPGGGARHLRDVRIPRPWRPSASIPYRSSRGDRGTLCCLRACRRLWSAQACLERELSEVQLGYHRSCPPPGQRCQVAAGQGFLRCAATSPAAFIEALAALARSPRVVAAI